MTVIKLLFSKAAATRSLSASCLFTADSDECVPGVISTVTLNRGGSDRSSLTRIDKPINVAMLQCGIVGVKLTKTSLCSLSTLIKLCWTTCNSSRVRGCSGSFMNRIKSASEQRNWYETFVMRNRIAIAMCWRDVNRSTYQTLRAHQMDRSRCHPNRPPLACGPHIFCTHSGWCFRFPFLFLFLLRVIRVGLSVKIWFSGLCAGSSVILTIYVKTSCHDSFPIELSHFDIRFTVGFACFGWTKIVENTLFESLRNPWITEVSLIHVQSRVPCLETIWADTKWLKHPIDTIDHRWAM